jgi:hypothetical protein
VSTDKKDGGAVGVWFVAFTDDSAYLCLRELDARRVRNVRDGNPVIFCAATPWSPKLTNTISIVTIVMGMPTTTAEYVQTRALD